MVAWENGKPTILLNLQRSVKPAIFRLSIFPDRTRNGLFPISFVFGQAKKTRTGLLA